MCIPACSQIWAKVIQGCRGPCLGALLCREEATSERACSTRLAAIDVACTEPGGRELNHYTRRPLKVKTYCYNSIRPLWATVQASNSTKYYNRFHWLPSIKREKMDSSVKSGLFGCNKELKNLGPHWHTVSCSKAFNQPTPVHMLQHSVSWPWINHVRM